MADGDWEEQDAVSLLQALARTTALARPAPAAGGRPSQQLAQQPSVMHEETPVTVSKCWGQQLSPLTRCNLDFTPGRNHFQNHFCPSCRELGIDIPAERVRGLRREQRHELENSNAFGMWSKHGTRLVNQTSGCTGPLLVIFKEPPSAWGPCSLPAVLAREAAWEPVPPDWSGPTTVHFAVAKGTLVPKGALSYRSTKTYSSGPGGTVIGTYARNGPVPDREHGAREGAADVLEVRLTDQLLMLDAMLGDCETSAGRVLVKAVVAQVRALGTRLLRFSQ